MSQRFNFYNVTLVHQKLHCLKITKAEIKRVTDQKRAIAGLLWFQQRCPLQVPVLGHFSVLQIVFQKKKKQGNVIFP